MNDRNFTYQPMASRVKFGRGSIASVAEEGAKIGRRALILSTPEQAEDANRVAQMVGELCGGVFTEARMHVPTTTVEHALEQAMGVEADFCIAIGGGSTTGLAKALSLRADLPSLVIPTTYAGSEVTPIYGLTENGVKTTGRDKKVVPTTVIYDPELTLTLPVDVSVASGLNAIAHSMEGLYAHDGNPIVSIMAEESIRVMAKALPRIKLDADDIEARTDALYASWLAGNVLAGASIALHHKLCHTLGGLFDMPHAQTHTAVLPHAIAYNASAAPEAMRRAGKALESSDPAMALYELAAGLGAEMSLAKLGMPVEGIHAAANQAVQNPYPNPRKITVDGIRELLGRALVGDPPATQF